MIPCGEATLLHRMPGKKTGTGSPHGVSVKNHADYHVPIALRLWRKPRLTHKKTIPFHSLLVPESI